MKNAGWIVGLVVAGLAGGAAWLVFRKKKAPTPEPEPEPGPGSGPGGSLWKVGQILVLSSGERWQILEVIPGPPVAYRAKWLDTGSIATVLESTFVAADAVIEGPPPAAVTVTLRALNPPANAAYWCAFCKQYQSCDWVPISQPIVWANIPPDTLIYGGASGGWGIMITCYDANYVLLAAPNTNHNIGFSKPFTDGWTYYWDFFQGLLLDPYLKGM